MTRLCSSPSLPRCNDLFMKTFGFGRRLHTEHDRKQFATAPEHVERFGPIAGRCERAHQTAVERLREVVSFEPAAVEIDRAAPIGMAFEIFTQLRYRPHESRT